MADTPDPTPASPTPPPKRRRSLTHVGGAIDVAGHPADADKLAFALDVAPSTDDDDDPARSHVHGFHTYPARMHPLTAARLVEAFCRPGGRLLDPFCGSGTVLVEALVAGRRPLGTDLNPLAVRLARCKTRPRRPDELGELTERAAECAASADARRKSKAGASRRLLQDDVDLFEPHVLMELDSLRAAVEGLEDSPAKLDLSLVLSAVLVKLSKRKSDTTVALTGRRTAPGYAARLFVKKAEDLARRFGVLAGLLPDPPPPPAIVAVEDATFLRVPREPVDAIVTSPPYAATYDYLRHHELRLRWLGLERQGLAEGEIGSRTGYRRLDPEAARGKWEWELGRFLSAAARLLPVGGPLVMVLADSAVAGEPLRAEEITADAARRCGFDPVARASQPRPHFHEPTAAAFRDRPRCEHAVLLRRAAPRVVPVSRGPAAPVFEPRPRPVVRPPLDPPPAPRPLGPPPGPRQAGRPKGWPQPSWKPKHKPPQVPKPKPGGRPAWRPPRPSDPPASP